jgi:hypothetical protein
MLGKKSLIIYLFSIIFGSLIFGYLLDMFLIDVDFESIVDIDEFGVLHYVSSVILFSLLLYTTFVPKRAY